MRRAAILCEHPIFNRPRRDLEEILEDFSGWLMENFQMLVPLPSAYGEMMMSLANC